jgi:hypothetical protein
MVKAASETIAFVPYLLQNVLPWCYGVGTDLARMARLQCIL